LTTDSTSGGAGAAGLHYITTQYVGISRLDNRFDRWLYRMAQHDIVAQYLGSSKLENSMPVATVLTGGIDVKFGRNNDCTEVSESFLYHFWTHSKYKLKVLNH